MDVKRRQFMGVSAAGIAGALAMSPDAARAAPLASTFGRDATQYGVRPGSPDDQTKALQRAIDEAARAQVPLSLPPGVYRTGLLRLQNGSQLVGVRGATKFVFSGGASMLQSEGAGGIGLSGITFDGGAARAASGDIAIAPAMPAAETPMNWRRFASMIRYPRAMQAMAFAGPKLARKCAGAW